MADVGEWLDQATRDQVSHLRGNADTAKLVATFASGIAATLVGTDLQIRSGHMGGGDWVAVVALAMSFVGALWVVAEDRLRLVDVERVLSRQAALGVSSDQAIAALRTYADASATYNQEVLRRVRLALVCQVVASAVSGSSAAYMAWGGLA